MPEELSSPDAIRSLYTGRFQINLNESAWRNWRRAYVGIVERVRSATAEELASPDFQKTLWDENPISATGMGHVPMAQVVASEPLRAWVASLRDRPLPQSQPERREALGEVHRELLERVRPLTSRLPRLKVLRLLAAIFPADVTCLVAEAKLRAVARSLFGRSDLGNLGPIALNARILDRIAEAVGPPADDVNGLVARSIFAWQLFEVADGQTSSQRGNTDLATVIRRYRADGTVFRSPDRGVMYRVGDAGETGFDVVRLDAREPQRVTYDWCGRRAAELAAAGPWHAFADVSPTVAQRVALLQDPRFALGPDRKTLHVVDTPEYAADLFDDLIRSLNVNRVDGVPKLYKPMMLAAVADMAAADDLPANRIAFDAVLPRFLAVAGRLGVEAGDQQAAEAFYHLSGDLFWNLSYQDPDRPIRGEDGVSPAALRARVKFASVKDTFWPLLLDEDGRERVLATLAAAWWPGAEPQGRRFWWVNQGRTFEAERAAGLIWAPRADKNGGQPPFHWVNVSEVRVGDVVFHYAGGDVRAVSLARGDGGPRLRPEEVASESWSRDGWAADVGYHVLTTPVPLSAVSAEMLKMPRPYGPLNRNGGVNQGYLYSLTPDQAAAIAARLDLDALPDEIARALRTAVSSPLAVLPAADPTASVEALADRLLLDAGFLRDVVRLLDAKRQVIFYGPPGTGKTYVALDLANHVAGDPSRVTLVQFHPSYAYEDFVEGYRPCLRRGVPGFRLVRGPLLRAAEAARAEPGATHVLVIDEVNRGNVAKVFGEMYFLLEYRDRGVRLQYRPGRAFSLPPNLWVIGTMNTADRSIALLDAALRRRFFFVPFFPDAAPVAGLLRRWLARHKPGLEWVAAAVDAANRRLGDRHAAIGPSHFMTDRLDEAWARTVWDYAVLPYLAEQFFEDEDRLAEFALDRLRNGDATSVPVGGAATGEADAAPDAP